VGDALTLADIVFAAELVLFSAERASRRVLSEAALTPLYGEELCEKYPRALAHFARLCAHESFAPDLGPYLEKLEVRRV
jgi:glutathione S-transferase